jgi:RNA polymerase sigma factor (sigma-70 family)
MGGEGVFIHHWAPLQAELYYLGFLYAIGIGLIGDDAEDCAMALVLKSLQQPWSFKPAESSIAEPSYWRRRVARNFVRDFGRQHVRQSCVSLDSLGPDTSWLVPHTDVYRSVDAWLDLVTALDGLSPEESYALTALHLRGEETAQIARALGRSEVAVRQLLVRARRRVSVSCFHR